MQNFADGKDIIEFAVVMILIEVFLVFMWAGVSLKDFDTAYDDRLRKLKSRLAAVELYLQKTGH